MAREDYRRIESAATSRPDWIYSVLTVDPSKFRDRWSAFRAMRDLWGDALQKRLQRQFGRIEYVQTWEQHRSGWPHGNLLLRSDALLAHVRELGVEPRSTGDRVALWPAWRKPFRRMAIDCGFGELFWAELVEPRGESGMAAYLAKHTLAAELTRSHAKPGDQRPTAAPRHFRRLRSSRGLLPPRVTSSGEWTGFMVRTPVGLLADRATGELALSMDDVERLWIREGGAAARTAARRWRERWTGASSAHKTTED